MISEDKVSKDKDLSGRIIPDNTAQNYEVLLQVSNSNVSMFIENCARWTDDSDKECYAALKDRWKSIEEEFESTESLDECVKQRNGYKSPEELNQFKFHAYETKVRAFQRGFTSEQLTDIFKGHYLSPEFRSKLEEAIETTIMGYLIKRAEELGVKYAEQKSGDAK